MQYGLLDTHKRQHFFPFTLSRPLSACRAGILAITEKWQLFLKQDISLFSAAYLAGKFPFTFQPQEPLTLISGHVLPDSGLVEAIKNLQHGQVLYADNEPLAAVFKQPDELPLDFGNGTRVDYSFPLLKLEKITDLFYRLGDYISADFKLITDGRKSQPLHESNTVIGSHPVFLEEGARVFCSIINTEAGPVYIGNDAEIMEGCMIRGPLSLGDHAALKMGAKIYGPTVIGPHSRVGGEVSNSNIFGYSNKGHDGFLGNSVLGEWCNLGADTNNSNLKNNYGQVKIHRMYDGAEINTGLQFCGLLMGDHCKSGINTMFNTGTVAGFCANIFDGGFPPKFIPSFSWGGKAGDPVFDLQKAKEAAMRMFERRNVPFTEGDHKIFDTLYTQ